jgi:hypothetical protein
MRWSLAITLLSLLGAAPAVLPSSAAALPGQQVIDRIVARIEGDIITLSEVRELSAYQQLIDGHAESDDRLLNELIEQWVVNNEATEAQFPPAAESEVNREVDRIRSRFPAPQAYNERLAALGITPQTVRRLVAREIYLARYLDYKFRPAVQVDDEAIAKYYREKLVPEMAAKKQTAPPLSAVSDQIRELLVQQGVNERAASWFEETKSRLKIEIEPATAASSKATP